MRHRLIREIFSDIENAEPAFCGDAFDEYRELAMLADAWERSSRTPIALAGDPSFFGEALLALTPEGATVFAARASSGR